MTPTAAEDKTPPSAAEQARLRRERREKKILAQGTSRLEKISGLQGGATAREALSSPPHPDPPEHDIGSDSALSPLETPISPGASATSPDTTRRAFSPSRNVFAVDGGDEDPFNMLRGGNDPMANVPEELRNDPMMKLLLKNPLFEHLAGSGGAAGRDGPSRDSSSDDLNRLAERLNQQLFGPRSASQFPNGGGAVAEEVVPADRSVWKWKLARVIGVVTVLYYLWTQIEDIHFSRTMDISLGIPVFYTFIVFSLSLQALRLILDKGRPVPGSWIATIGSLLPHPFGTALLGFARYRVILTDVLEDFAALLFGMALMYWLKTR